MYYFQISQTKRKQRIPHDVFNLSMLLAPGTEVSLELVKRFPIYSERNMYIYILCIYIYYVYIYICVYIYYNMYRNIYTIFI